MVRIVACLVGCGVFCSLSIPALGNPPGHVIVVDGAGGGTFLQIQPAVDAAQDGDTILVRNGSYAAFTVTNKALVVVGDGSGVAVTGEVHAEGLASGKSLALVGLHVTGAPASGALVLASDAGKIRAVHCTFAGGTLRDGGDGVSIQSCPDVAFMHCSISGGEGVNGMVDDPAMLPGHAGRGISASSATLTIHESGVLGGIGQPGDYGLHWDGGSGGDACRMDQSTLYAALSQFTGGNGGDGNPSSCLGAYGGSAGYGLSLFGSGTLGRMLNDMQVGGTPGCDSGPLCTPDCEPQYPARVGGPYVDLSASAAYFDVPSPVRESTTLPITVRGRQGDAVFLMRSDRSRNLYMPAWGSMMLVRLQSPDDVVYLGTLPAGGGPVVYHLQLPDLGPGVESTTTYLQVMFQNPTAPRRLSGVCALVVLDSAF